MVCAKCSVHFLFLIGLTVGQHPNCLLSELPIFIFLMSEQIFHILDYSMYQVMVNFIRFISWNINGSQNPLKRKKCLSYLKSQQADVALIQETLVDSEIIKFKRDLLSSFIAPILAKNVGWQYLNLNGVEVNLCNIYTLRIRKSQT